MNRRLRPRELDGNDRLARVLRVAAEGRASPLRDAGVAAHSRYNASVGDGNGVGMADALHERMSSLLSRFNGVSTRMVAPMDGSQMASSIMAGTS